MKRKNAQKKRKKALLRAKKSSKKSALRGIPLGALWGNFRGAKKWLRHVCAPRKCKEGVAVHLLNHLLLLPRPPPAPRLAPPLQSGRPPSPSPTPFAAAPRLETHAAAPKCVAG